MEHRILSTALHGVGFVTFIIACFVFFLEDHAELSNLVSFVPAVLAFTIGSIVGLLSPEVVAPVLNDPFTVFVFFVAIILVLSALFFMFQDEDQNAKELFGWAFTFTSFGTGMEVGKSRAKRKSGAAKKSKEKPTSEYASKSDSENEPRSESEEFDGGSAPQSTGEPPEKGEN